MASSSHPPFRRRNILTLDAGGIRGLSSLLILQDLMQHINTAIRSKRLGKGTHRNVEPHEIFDFIAGASSGGLIVVMLGKLRMTLKECIQVYHDFSEKKKHARGSFIRGLSPARDSEKSLENQIKLLIQSRNFPVDMGTSSYNNCGSIACAVIGRYNAFQLKNSELKEGSVLLCSLPRRGEGKPLVTESERAKGADIKYIPIQNINSHYFSHECLEYNNPSKTVFDHFARPEQLAQARRNAGQPEEAASSTFRFINLGTGSISQPSPPRERDLLANLAPRFTRKGIFSKINSAECAVEAENVASFMTLLDRVSNAGSSIDFKYYRFSADNGLCLLKTDQYKALDLIEELTEKYIRKEKTQAIMEEIAEEIGNEYLECRDNAVAPATAFTEIDVDDF